MKRFFLFLILVPYAFPLETFTLKNGMRIILVKRDIPAVFLTVYYRAGSFFDPPGQEGMAYLTSRISFAGRRKSRPWEQVFFLKRIGGEINVEDNQDYAIYSSYFPREELPLALWYEMERMKSVFVKKEAFYNEKRKLSAEVFNQMRNNPWLIIYSAILRSNYYSTPYSHLPWGLPGNIKRISLKSLLEFYNTYYQPATATMIIIGNIGEQEKSLISKMFSLLKGTPIMLPEKVEFPARDFKETMESRVFKNPGFVISYRVSNPSCIQRVYLELINEAIRRRIHDYKAKKAMEGKIKFVVSHFVFSSLISIMYLGKDYKDIEKFLEDEITRLKIYPMKENELNGLKMDFIRRIREEELNPVDWGRELGSLSLIYRCSEERVLSETISLNNKIFRDLVRSNFSPFNRARIYLKPWQEK